MNRARRPLLQYPLAPLFDRAVHSLCVALSPETTRHYRGTVRNFLSYLGTAHPAVKCLNQLRREPHILGWMSRLRSQVPPLATSSYIQLLIALRPLLTELAWTEQLPQLAKGCDILIGTPGRLCDFINRPHILTLRRLKYMVIDEADEMVGSDWETELKQIMSGGGKSFKSASMKNADVPNRSGGG